MRKLMLIFSLLPLLGLSQGLLLQSDTGVYSNGDSLFADFHLEKFILDFKLNEIRYENNIYKELKTENDSVYRGWRSESYKMRLQDTIYIGGNPYSTIDVFNAIIDAQDLNEIKIVNRKLIELFPLKKYQN